MGFAKLCVILSQTNAKRLPVARDRQRKNASILSQTDWGSPAFAMAGGPAYNAGAGAGSAAASELRGIVDALRGMRVVLSTGETVGALTVPLNDSLGNQYSYSKRGI